jgi:hypothetical protein
MQSRAPDRSKDAMAAPPPAAAAASRDRTADPGVLDLYNYLGNIAHAL